MKIPVAVSSGSGIGVGDPLTSAFAFLDPSASPALDGLRGKVLLAQVAEFVAQTGISFPVTADVGSLWQFDFPSGVGYPYPRDVVVGKDLTVRAIRNSFSATEIEALVLKLLAE
jgi:hypothetical protein